MSDTFDRFLKQYHAQGREKADGYDRSHFDGLTDDEKIRAFELLAREAEGAPETATPWLFHLDPPRAEAVTLDQIAKKKGDPYGENYVRQFELLNYTHDLAYQRAMLDDYPLYTRLNKSDALHRILRTPDTPELRRFVRDVLLRETDASAVAAAAIGFLRLHRVPKDAPQERAIHKAYGARLKNPSPQVRADAVREIEQKYPLPP